MADADNHTGIDLDALEEGATCADGSRGGDTGVAVPSFGRWVVDDSGTLLKRTLGRDGKEVVAPVTSTPPVVVADLRDVDTGAMRALVAFRVRGRWVERAVERESLFSNARIVPLLAPLGANVSSDNAKSVVAYLTECDARGSGDRDVLSTSSRMGWVGDGRGDGLGSFIPFDGGVRFDPSLDLGSFASPFMEPAGTLAGWVAGVSGARSRSVAFRAMVAASFASALVRTVGCQTFVVYLWGRSRSGKTPTLKAAGSVWGNPAEGPNSYYGTFADTPKSVVRKATLLGDVPVIVDELQSREAHGGQAGKRSSVEDLVYTLSLGHERAALRADRTMMATGSWKSLTLATGEIPILGGGTQRGAVNC